MKTDNRKQTAIDIFYQKLSELNHSLSIKEISEIEYSEEIFNIYKYCQSLEKENTIEFALDFYYSELSVNTLYNETFKSE